MHAQFRKRVRTSPQFTMPHRTTRTTHATYHTSEWAAVAITLKAELEAFGSAKSDQLAAGAEQDSIWRTNRGQQYARNSDLDEAEASGSSPHEVGPHTLSFTKWTHSHTYSALLFILILSLHR